MILMFIVTVLGGAKRAIQLPVSVPSLATIRDEFWIFIKNLGISLGSSGSRCGINIPPYIGGEYNKVPTFGTIYAGVAKW